MLDPADNDQSYWALHGVPSQDERGPRVSDYEYSAVGTRYTRVDMDIMKQKTARIHDITLTHFASHLQER